ncbi:MAG: hypothetical protein ACI8QZ_003736 [Chlamydiales bacterium]|jgi:hypothetical protein
MHRRGPRPRAIPLLALLAGAVGLLLFLWARGVVAPSEGRAGLAALDGPSGPGDASRRDLAAEPVPGEALELAREALSGVADPPQVVDRDVAQEAGIEDMEWIDVRIVDRDSGAPIAGASVFQYRPEGPLETTADADGGLRLATLGVPIRVRHAAYVDVFAPRIPDARPVRIELTRSLRLSGRLVDPASAAISGVSVRLGGGTLDPGLDLDETPPTDLLIHSDDDGRFVFEGLRPGRYTLLIAEADELHAARLEQGVEVWTGDERERIFVLDSGATLSGQVRWRQENVPIADVRIEVSPAWELWEDGEPPRRRVLTDADGHFEIPGLARAPYELRARAPWGATVTREIMSPGSGESFECNLELRQPAQVSGRVYDSEGEHVAAARVWITSRPEGRDFDWSDLSSASMDTPFLLATLSGGNGDYHFDNVPTREALWILALPPGPAAADERPAYFEPLRVVEGQARTGLDLTLAGVLQLEGLVTDEGARSLAGVHVEAWHVRWGRTSPGRTATTDTDGRFSVGPLPFGATRIEFSHDGYRDAVQSARLEEGDPQTIEQELVQAHPITGWVVDEAGLGISGARVRARAVEPVGPGPKKGSTTSDIFGAFEIDGLKEGRWKVDASASGFSPLDRSGIEVRTPDPAPLLFVLAAKTLDATGSVHGEVHWKASGRPVWDLEFSGKRGGVARLSGAGFELHGIRPGRLRLVASAAGMEPLIFDPVEVLPGADLDLGRHEVSSATRLTVAVRNTTGTLLRDGVSVRMEPLPVAKQGCGKRQPKRRFVETNTRGIFLHEAVPRCHWRLRVTHDGFAPYSEIVRVSGPRQTIAVSLKPR